MWPKSLFSFILAAILAFGAASPALMESASSDGLIVVDQEAVLSDPVDVPWVDEIVIDLPEDILEGSGQPAVFPSGAFAANYDSTHSTLPYAGLPVIGTDVETPAAGCVILGLPGSYVSDVANALSRINEIRLEACREGVDNPDNPGTPLTLADYVPIKWSSGLEYIARIRAAEASVTMAHERLNGRLIWGLASPSGVTSWGEVIAWNWSGGVIQEINQWYEEKADWVNKTPGAATGHYTQMIQPSHLYVGLGTFCGNAGHYFNTTVGEFSFVSGLDEAPMPFTGACIQKLEVDGAGISGGSLLGTMSGISGDTSELMLAASVLGCDFLVLDSVVWWSASPGIASVDATGTVTAISCGAAAITADCPGVTGASANFTDNHLEQEIPAVEATYVMEGRTKGSYCAVCGEVLVEQKVVPMLEAKKVKLDLRKATLTVGKTLKLKATLTPDHRTAGKVNLTWSTSDERVATVTAKGKVKAVGVGKATVTVTTPNGKKASCKITVKAKKK